MELLIGNQIATLAMATLVMTLGCERTEAGPPPPVLLFAGVGASKGDVEALEAILEDHHVRHAVADSERLDGMSDSELSAYRLLIVPGGNFEVIGQNLEPGTSAKIRRAIAGGVNYLGICAGAFFAGASPYNGLNLTAGVRFPFYSAEAAGIRRAALRIESPAAPPLEHYWEDGPELSGWGDVVGRYPDGTPAIVQGTFGSGGVLLVGVHPEAPESWRWGLTFATPASTAQRYAATLISAALDRTPLPHF